MRFMMFMYPGKNAESGAMPDPTLMSAMMKYNEELTKAGVLIALDGLHPSAKGARVRFTGGKPKVIDGPFTEAKELVGGYWMIQVKSKEEAVEWASRAPCPEGEMIEVRRVFEMAEFDIDPQSELAGQSDRVGAVVRKAGKA
jgi:hypothetical protein